jgi:hypothetical protein
LKTVQMTRKTAAPVALRAPASEQVFLRTQEMQKMRVQKTRKISAETDRKYFSPIAFQARSCNTADKLNQKGLNLREYFDSIVLILL